jgi:3-hydroxyisobutyrate dehydrogenase-like beta-hydroxyacid dehydrogenase
MSLGGRCHGQLPAEWGLPFETEQRIVIALTKLSSGAARSGTLERTVSPAIAGDYRGYLFTTANAVKDLASYLEAAKTLGADARVAEAMRDCFKNAAAQHGGDTMLSELLKPR